jgi:hypothetical protein
VCERVDEFLAKQVEKPPESSFDENSVTQVYLLAAFSRHLSRCHPCAICPPLLHCFAYRRPGISTISPQRETVHEQETREGAREASLQRMDVAEECAGLHADAIETGCEQSSSMRAPSHTSILTDRLGDENGLSSSVVARSTKDSSDGFVGHARPQQQPGARILGVR